MQPFIPLVLLALQALSPASALPLGSTTATTTTPALSAGSALRARDPGDDGQLSRETKEKIESEMEELRSEVEKRGCDKLAEKGDLEGYTECVSGVVERAKRAGGLEATLAAGGDVESAIASIFSEPSSDGEGGDEEEEELSGEELKVVQDKIDELRADS